ncbi:MAG: hypothetical protein K6F53_00990 [Lachnospiraceae bacterium]|nr:hypothetical protein [Lachnospiraceae bacterium]
MIVCPNCGMNLKFNIPLQKLYCDSCNSSFDPYAFDSKTSDGIEKAKDEGEEDTYEATVFTCPQCGGEIESTDTDITGFCSFCGASTIFYSRIKEEKKPDFILPFIKTKEECKAAFSAKAKRNPYVPKEYRDPSYIDGFRGIYMPYWSYNVDQKGPSSIPAELTHHSGDYIIHEHYKLSGDLDAFYHGITHDASSSFSDDISGAIAPYDVKQKKPFTAGYLSGFYADTADVSQEIYRNEVQSFADKHTTGLIKKEPPFRRYTFKDDPKMVKLNTKLAPAQKTLFPVWFLSFRKGDRIAYAAVNGQTGKVTADLPISLGRFYAGAAIISVLVFLLLNLIFTVKPRTTSVFALILSLITAFLYFFELNNMNIRDNKTDDKGYQSKIQNLDDPAKKRKVTAAVNVAAKNEHKASVPALVCLFGGAGVSLLGVLIKTIHDPFYYVIDVIAAILVAITLMFLIRDYNLLTTRPLPQFQKRGGDDNA